MRFWTLIVRSLFFYRRTHVGALLGTAIATAVLVGALVVGDSVRESLVQTALSRLGRTEFALSGGDRFFRAALADDLARELKSDVAPVLMLRGVAARADGSARANSVQVLGVDDRFWAMGMLNAQEVLKRRRTEWDGLQASRAEDEDLSDGLVTVNDVLAARLGVAPGDDFVLRVERPSLMPSDAPLSSHEGGARALRVRVTAVAGPSEFGRFGMKSSQLPPLTVCLPLTVLAREVGRADRCNLLLVAGRPGSNMDVDALDDGLRRSFKLSDAELEVTDLGDQGVIELRSDRVFLDPAVDRAAAALGLSGTTPIVTYFVNRLRAGDRSTPYSFVSFPGPGLVPEDMGDDEIVINAWLADDLQVSTGGVVDLDYMVPGSMGGLEERTNTFRVKSVVPVAGLARDRTLMPKFPGLVDVANCRDWDSALPIDLDAIRPQDEVYWDVCGGTPKAFVTLRAARGMWANPFGSLTAVRFDATWNSVASVTAALQDALDPADLGLTFRPVRDEGLRAGREAVDFGQLFLGLSFFIVVAALILTGLLFAFSMQQRSEEAGLLLAVGFRFPQVRRCLMAEGGLLAMVGVMAGAPLGLLYNQLVLHGLGTVWRGATGVSGLRLALSPATLLVGMSAGAGVALLSMWVATRGLARRTIGELQTSGGRSEAMASAGRVRGTLRLAGICAGGALLILLMAGPGRGKDAAGAFFGAGGLLLSALLCLCRVALMKAGRRTDGAAVRIGGLALRNCGRRPSRSLAVIGLLACGVFIVVAVGANRHDPLKGIHSRSSGTGGFALYGETAIPVLQDLNSEEGRNGFGLQELGASVGGLVPMRVRDGDDASCLNLNRVERPRILGVRADAFAARDAFTFVKTVKGADVSNPWLLLDIPLDDGAIPAVADQSTIVWGLGKSVGETLTYVDDQGRRLDLRFVGGLANSVLQGSVLISERAFRDRFPSAGGCRAFLVDAEPEAAADVASTLSRALSDVGMDIGLAAERLAAFSEVENTYLAIFLALGGLGLVLGSVGTGLVVMRNVLERRGELATLRALGFRWWTLRRMLLIEHGTLLAAGLAAGILAAAVATLPALVSPGGRVPWLSLVVVLGAVVVNGFVWIGVAAFAATRGELMAALRNE